MLLMAVLPGSRENRSWQTKERGCESCDFVLLWPYRANIYCTQGGKHEFLIYKIKVCVNNFCCLLTEEGVVLQWIWFRFGKSLNLVEPCDRSTSSKPSCRTTAICSSLRVFLEAKAGGAMAEPALKKQKTVPWWNLFCKPLDPVGSYWFLREKKKTECITCIRHKGIFQRCGHHGGFKHWGYPRLPDLLWSTKNGAEGK